MDLSSRGLGEFAENNFLRAFEPCQPLSREGNQSGLVSDLAVLQFYESTWHFAPFVVRLGYDRAKKVGGFIAKRHDLRRVVTNLAVLDFNSPDNSMQLVSVHPGVSVDDVVANTGFELVIPANVPVSRPPTAEESAAIEAIDPKGLRHREIPA